MMRIHSPMPVREARRYADSLDRFWGKVQKIWNFKPRDTGMVWCQATQWHEYTRSYRHAGQSVCKIEPINLEPKESK